MQFFAQGCCRFDFYKEKSYGKKTEEDCQNMCLHDEGCQGMDVRGVSNEGKQDCMIYSIDRAAMERGGEREVVDASK